ncbi:MAG TPA: indolepyruvate oxidoreductase subunit beta [Verrucomicrobiae bacterium]|nr:indolepyruvate oxidoreductase subunit beta [Verrucomicrobiae bacterium]
MSFDMVITGVGGQGSVLASRAIALTAMQKGYQVRTSETIGMAQREGSVISNVRVGGGLYGAIIPDNKADILMSFELAETARGIGKLKPGGVIIVNRSKIIPVSVPLGISVYDEGKIIAALKAKADKVILLDATQGAVAAGSAKTVNVVLMGVLSTLKDLPFTRDELLSGILELIPQRARDANIRAFEIGCTLAEVS